MHFMVLKTLLYVHMIRIWLMLVCFQVQIINILMLIIKEFMILSLLLWPMIQKAKNGWKVLHRLYDPFQRFQPILPNFWYKNMQSKKKKKIFHNLFLFWKFVHNFNIILILHTKIKLSTILFQYFKQIEKLQQKTNQKRFFNQ